MSLRKILDTNHLSEAVMPVSVVRDRLAGESRRGIIFGTIMPVLCELEVGVRGLGRQEPVRRELRHLLNRVRVWPLNPGFPAFYADVAMELRALGRTLSTVDMMLAALCREMDLVLLTADRDFEALPDLRVENWLS